MNFNSFSHGQVQSKVWLCKELEKFVHANLKIAILGSWYNLVAFMLLTRNADRYQHILGVDIDPDVKETADKITDAWRIGNDYKVENITADANVVDLAGYDLVINCSVEHMDGTVWFDKLEKDTMVCIQSSNMQTINDDVWKCINANSSIDDLLQKYPLSRYLYSGEKEFRYSDDNGYKRFMIIGIK